MLKARNSFSAPEAVPNEVEQRFDCVQAQTHMYRVCWGFRSIHRNGNQLLKFLDYAFTAKRILQRPTPRLWGFSCMLVVVTQHPNSEAMYFPPPQTAYDAANTSRIYIDGTGFIDFSEKFKYLVQFFITLLPLMLTLMRE